MSYFEHIWLKIEKNFWILKNAMRSKNIYGIVIAIHTMYAKQKILFHFIKVLHVSCDPR